MKKKEIKPKKLTQEQLKKLTGAYTKCSSVWCCSGSFVRDGCTDQTAIIRR
ncbi:MAG: hypothetical protein HY698_00835 [Deltaproteobacteria bacterium]|nr:hypothetical protein [Deltaproteobacteria bacterium]